ncbi:MAG: DNA-3-methyladenine glycosylase [Rhizobiaceae bacterium]
MRPINSDDDVTAGLDALCALDARLSDIRKRAGDIPLRRSPPGFESLVSIIVSQQVSRASAQAIFDRLAGLLHPLSPLVVLEADDRIFRQAGLSRPKQKTIVATARAIAADGLDLQAVCSLNANEAMAGLTAIPGIGPWTAEVYLLVCAGHPDVFPAKDIALQAAVADAIGHDARPDDKALYAIAESWKPWRSVAARLLWAYYRELRGREAAIGG